MKETYKGYRIEVVQDEMHKFELFDDSISIAIENKYGDCQIDRRSFDKMLNDKPLYFADETGFYDAVAMFSSLLNEWFIMDFDGRNIILGRGKSADDAWDDACRRQDIPVEDDFYYLPVYKYEHSGVAYNTTGFSCGWDSGQVGYVYCEKSLFGAEEESLRVLKGVIENLSDCASGNVWGFVVSKIIKCECCEHVEYEEVDSCWGFVGDHDYCLEEAKSAVDNLTEA